MHFKQIWSAVLDAYGNFVGGLTFFSGRFTFARFLPKVTFPLHLLLLLSLLLFIIWSWWWYRPAGGRGTHSTMIFLWSLNIIIFEHHSCRLLLLTASSIFSHLVPQLTKVVNTAKPAAEVSPHLSHLIVR